MVKPLGKKAYGSIPHLPGSRLGPGDHRISDGQAIICLSKPRDRHDVVIVSEKLDGCLPYRVRITTDRGSIEIGQIVNHRLPVNVLSYNSERGIVEYKPIVTYHRQPQNQEWVRIIVRARTRGNATRVVLCTPNHRIYSNGNWIEAEQVKPGQPVALLGDILGTEMQQVILGGLLGDSSILQPRENNQRGIVFSHSEPQFGYFDFKVRLLSPLIHEIKGTRGGYEGSKPNRRAVSFMTPSLDELIFRCCQRNGKKCVTDEWAQELSALGLAIWYMDDGSCRFTKEQRPRAHISTNGFSFEEVEMLAAMLHDRFNVNGGIFDYKGPTIVLTADGTERFFDLIYPYVPSSMKYKLPPHYANRLCVLEEVSLASYQGLLETEVLSVDRENVLPYEKRQAQFDLTVADNHNYFANGVLVHNSNVAIAKVQGQVIPLTRAGYRAETSRYTMHHLFASWVMRQYARFDGCLTEGERLSGEWLAQAHGTRYDLPHAPFVVFDWFAADERVPYEELLARCQAAGLVTPRLLSKGPPFSLESALAAIETSGHGALEAVEGAVWRVERRGLFDYLAKWVRPDKVDGKYLPSQSGDTPVWNTWPGSEDWKLEPADSTSSEGSTS